MYWPLKIALARLRPWSPAAVARLGIVVAIFSLMLTGEFLLFRRVFDAVTQIESLSPFFALGILMNLLGLAFLVAILVLFFSTLTTSIGAFFTDHDLEAWHATPVTPASIIRARFLRTFFQSAAIVFVFLIPIIAAFASEYSLGPLFVLRTTTLLLLLFVTPVALGASVILLLIRFFPARRVEQIAATIAIVMLTVLIVGIRVARPERLFTQIDTDDLRTVLETIALPNAELYPSNWLAESMVVAVTESETTAPSRLALLAIVSLTIFFTLARLLYYTAFVRARESSAPVAIGGDLMTRFADSLVRWTHPQTRALASKEARILTRDATQWSQLFMMAALLFVYLHNIRLMPLHGDARASVLAYLNLGMSGFVCSAIALRFAYPSTAVEGRAFWLLRTSPISYRRLLWVKVLVYTAPLLLIALLLTAGANVLLDATPQIWWLTLSGSALMTVTLVALGVGMGAWNPDFQLDNPLQSAVSLGGFTYMAISLFYVVVTMALFARPFHRFILRVIFGANAEEPTAVRSVVIAVTISMVLIVLPLELARSRLARRDRI
jgi:ABC-2 type transport system permease protein